MPEEQDEFRGVDVVTKYRILEARRIRRERRRGGVVGRFTAFAEPPPAPVISAAELPAGADRVGQINRAVTVAEPGAGDRVQMAQEWSMAAERIRGITQESAIAWWRAAGPRRRV
jgi:hypothetical protein